MFLRPFLKGGFAGCLHHSSYPEHTAPTCLPPNGRLLMLSDPPQPVKTTGMLQPPLQIQISPEKSPESWKSNGETGPSVDLERCRLQPFSA